MLEGEMQTCFLGYTALAEAWRIRYCSLPPVVEGTIDIFAGHRAHALETRHAWLDLAAKAKAAFDGEVQNIISSMSQ